MLKLPKTVHCSRCGRWTGFRQLAEGQTLPGLCPKHSEGQDQARSGLPFGPKSAILRLKDRGEGPSPFVCY